MTNFTRRSVLTGGIAGAALVRFGIDTPVHAAAPIAGKQAPSVYRYRIGSMEVTIVSDGGRTFPLYTFVINVKKEDVNAAHESAYMPRDKMTIHYAPAVVNTADKLVAIDTGNGLREFVNSQGTVGLIIHNLAAASIDAKMVDMVIISHFHGDLVNGLLTADDQPTFPNGEAVASRLPLSIPGARALREGRHWVPGSPSAMEPEHLSGICST